jgi:ribosomal protein S18 acetylase RimI-like enzyme
MIEIRPACEADDDFLYELNRQTLGEVIEATWGPWDDEIQRGFHRRWFEPGRLEVVLVDGARVGVIDAHLGDDGIYYVARIEIAPDLQNRGIGTGLMGQLIDRARALDAPAIELHVLELNRVRALYERLGFRVVAEEPPRLRMRLDLI